MTADLLYTDVEDELRDSLRRMLSVRLSARYVSEAYEGRVDVTALWRDMVEMGLVGLLVPEELGGTGASMREAAVVAEELGRMCAPVPFLTSAVIATDLILAAGETQLAEAMAAGETIAALAVSAADRVLSTQTLVRSAEGGLSGRIDSVAGAESANVLIVPAQEPGGDLSLYLVQIPSNGVHVAPVSSLDMTRPLCDISLDGTSARKIATVLRVTDLVNDALQSGAVALSSEQLGVAGWCFETTLRHVKERYQFGRPIGSFQAIKHRFADLWVEIGQARAAARYAADVFARADDDLAVAAAVAQAWCSGVAVHAAEEAVQLHGGIGMTWESPVHLYLKRAKADELIGGSPFEHRSALAVLVDLPAR